MAHECSTTFVFSIRNEGDTAIFWPHHALFNPSAAADATRPGDLPPGVKFSNRHGVAVALCGSGGDGGVDDGASEALAANVVVLDFSVHNFATGAAVSLAALQGIVLISPAQRQFFPFHLLPFPSPPPHSLAF